MKCKNCGTENSDNIDYCKKCKQPLTKHEDSGGTVRGLINSITSMEMKRKIAIFLILISVVSIAGYTLYQHRMEGKYDDNYVSQMFILGLADTIQPEADASLNMKINMTNQRKTALNNAKTKYDRMKYLAGETKTWNTEMMGHASSNIEKEYCLALDKYVDLRYNYYNEMDTGINLSINGNEKEAQIYYQNAKKLIPEIQSQENTLKIIASKDPEFQKRIEELTRQVKLSIEKSKSKRMDYYFV